MAKSLLKEATRENNQRNGKDKRWERELNSSAVVVDAVVVGVALLSGLLVLCQTYFDE